MALWNDILSMLQAPFVGDLDIIHLFLLIGFVLLAIAAWILIINSVQATARELI